MKWSDIQAAPATDAQAPAAEPPRRMKWSDLTQGSPGTFTPSGDARERSGETVQPGLFQRMWDGLSGKDVSRAGRFGMGVGDPLYGGAQIGARMAAMPGGGVPEAAGVMMPDPQAEERIKTVDTAVQQREAGYQQREKAAGLGGFTSEWARLLGNVASPPNLAVGAVGGAAARGLGLAGRLGAASTMGAASGAMEPVASGDFGKEKAKQAGLGAAGGLVGGAAGEAVGSALGRAIAGNSPQAVDSAILSRYRSTVKPSRVGQASATQLEGQDRRILTAVDQIIQNRPNLQLTDEAGNQIRGALPRSLRQFTESIDQTKRSIFQQYDSMSSGAATAISPQNAARVRVGMNPLRQPPVRVDLAPAVKHLRDVAGRPEISDFHPNLAVEAEQLASNLEARGFYSPSEAQDIIQNLNRTLQGFYKNPTNETVSRASMLGPVVSALREGLDQAIENAKGPGYQALKLQYGALRSIERDVAGSVQREANKIPGGIGGIFADLAASEQALHGVITLNPAALARAGGIKVAQRAMKYINDPNRAIKRLFDQAAKRGAPPPSALRQGAGAAASYGFPALGGIGGGLAGAAAERPALGKPRPSVIGP